MGTCRGKNMQSGISRTLLGFFRLGWMQYQNFVRKIIKMLIIIWVQLKMSHFNSLFVFSVCHYLLYLLHLSMVMGGDVEE
jgi:hypothetical protein